MRDKLLLIGQNGQLGSEWRYVFERREIPYTGAGSDDLDISDHKAVEELFDREQPDFVINCAGYTAVDQAEEEQEKARAVNAEGARHLAEACRNHNAVLIHYSTDYVFPGRPEDQQQFPRGYPEQAPPEPVNFYGRSKLEGEEAIRDSLDNHIIMRVSWLNGVYGHNFIKTMYRLIQHRDSLQVVHDQYGAPTFTDNVVRNTICLMQNGFKGTVHLCSGGLINWYELASEIVKICRSNTRIVPVSTEEFGAKAPRPYFSKLDTGLMRSFEGSRIIQWQEAVHRLLHDPRFKTDS